MSEDEIFIFDERRRDFFQVDNVLITKYGPIIGPYGIAVYNCLACHAGKKRIAYPSYRTIAKEIGASRSTVMRAMEVLEEWKIVKKKVDKDGGKERPFENNKYYLPDAKDWKPIPSLTGTEGVSQEPYPLSGELLEVTETPSMVSGRDVNGVSQQHKQNSVQQNKINKTQQQNAAASPPVDVAASSSELNDEIVSDLITAGISPKSAARRLATQPELCQAWLKYLKANPNLGPGYLVERIKEGEMPIEAATTSQEPLPPQLPPIAPELREKAARNVFEKLPHRQAFILQQVELTGKPFAAVVWDAEEWEMDKEIRRLEKQAQL